MLTLTSHQRESENVTDAAILAKKNLRKASGSEMGSIRLWNTRAHSLDNPLSVIRAKSDFSLKTR